MKDKDPSLKQLDIIAQAIFDKKGFNILALDVRDICTMADYFVIAEGSVDRHTKALSGSISHALQEIGERPLQVEGVQSGDWIVMDYGNIVIHLFTPDLREKYAIENLWKQGKVVDVEIVVERPQRDQSC